MECVVGIVVEDAQEAFDIAVQNGGKPMHPPSVLQASDGQQSVMAEVHMYGDVVMRFMSGSFQVRHIRFYSQKVWVVLSNALVRLRNAMY